ncbi:MAG: hypothetical protein AABZ12_00730 [Planctomycetota bacterium]
MFTNRRVVNLMLATTTALGAAAIVSAEPIRLGAAQDQSQASTFSFNFGELGGVASATISDTNLAISVDPKLGTAEFVEYKQNIAPLLLPGGFNTGAIRVEIVPGSSTGLFDGATGVFTTKEQYAIHFEGDLSAFGLTSPVILESASSGTVNVLSALDGSVQLDWSGEGELANPFDPETAIAFTYTCDVNTAFAPTPEVMVDIALIPYVSNLSLPRGFANALLAKLDSASAAIAEGRENLAARNLNAFVNKVEARAGHSIDVADAAVLIDAAEGTITLLQSSGAKSGGKR